MIGVGLAADGEGALFLCKDGEPDSLDLPVAYHPHRQDREGPNESIFPDRMKGMGACDKVREPPQNQFWRLIARPKVIHTKSLESARWSSPFSLLRRRRAIVAT